MDVLDSSDEDDCQLYSRTAEHFIKKRDELQAKRREFEKVIDLLPEDEVENALEVENFSKRPLQTNNTSQKDCALEVENFSKRPLQTNNTSQKDCNPDVSLISVEDDSDLEDNMPLAELSRNLRRSKRHIKSPPLPRQKRPKRNTRMRRNKQRSRPRPTSQVTDLIVLDDDTGYPVDSLPPIDFNSRSHNKSRLSDEGLVISLDNIMNQDSDEDDMIGNDDMVTLTIEWNNGQKTTRKEFKLRRYQKFEAVFEELAKVENISTNRVLLMYDFKSVNPMDTPSSLNLKFYGALIGSVSATEINHNKANLDHESDNKNNSRPSGGIQVKLLLQSKQTLIFSVLKHQKMDVLYKKCAEELKCESSKLRLTFDGESVQPCELVSDLDVEDGDVFHVHLKHP